MKPLLIIILLSSFVFGDKIDGNFTTMDVRSSLLSKNQLFIKASYNRINDTIDILNLKATQLGSSNYGSIGNAIGIDLSLGYGINKLASIFFVHESLNIHYIDDMLENRKNELFLKINPLRDINSTMIDSVSIDFGFINNTSSDLDIKKDSILNSMFQKIKPNSDFKLSDGTLTYDGKTVILLDRYSKKVYPFIKISNMNDNSFYIRAIAGKKIQNSKIDFYAGLKTTNITTEISLEPADNTLLQDAIDSLSIPNLNRSEKSLFMGFIYSFKFKSYLFESNYEYMRMFQRAKEISYTNQNHILNATVSKIITDNFLIFIGGKAMINHFNGVIPYLYNKYTKTKYDKKYGYAKIGFVFNFDIM